MMRCHQARNSDGPVSCVMGISLGCFDIQNSVLSRPLHTIRTSSSYVYGSCVPAFGTTWVKLQPALRPLCQNLSTLYVPLGTTT